MGGPSFGLFIYSGRAKLLQQQMQVSGVPWIVLMNFTLTLITVYHHRIFFQIFQIFNITYLVSQVSIIVYKIIASLCIVL